VWRIAFQTSPAKKREGKTGQISQFILASSCYQGKTQFLVLIPKLKPAAEEAGMPYQRMEKVDTSSQTVEFLSPVLLVKLCF